MLGPGTPLLAAAPSLPYEAAEVTYSEGLGFSVDTHRTHLNEFPSLLVQFTHGVQVDVVTSVCHSGRIADVISTMSSPLAAKLNGT